MLDLDETIIHSVSTDNAKTQEQSILYMQDAGLAVYMRDWLLEFLYAFYSRDIDMDVGVCTKGDEGYCNAICDRLEELLKLAYNIPKT